MKTVINWKTSELPVGSVIEITVDNPTYRRSVPTTKTINIFRYATGWNEIGGGYDSEHYNPTSLDAIVGEEFELISVPADWYEEFRPVSLANSKWEVNRAGWVRIGGKIVNASEETSNFIGVGSSFITVKTAVRKAFCG